MTEVIIKQQQEFATEIYSKIQTIDPDVYLAGGAPRDWWFGIPARDLDFWMSVPSDLEGEYYTDHLLSVMRSLFPNYQFFNKTGDCPLHLSEDEYEGDFVCLEVTRETSEPTEKFTLQKPYTELLLPVNVMVFKEKGMAINQIHEFGSNFSKIKWCPLRAYQYYDDFYLAQTQNLLIFSQDARIKYVKKIRAKFPQMIHLQRME